MIKETLIALGLLANINLSTLGVTTPSAQFVQKEEVLAKRELDLTNRLPNKFGNQVFADNILLSLHYLKGDVESVKSSKNINSPEDINWEKVRTPFEMAFILKPGEVFAYHKTVLTEFSNPSYTMNSRFYMDEGYKALEGLGGNGVCHLASLINWVAKDAGLESVAHVNHDFYPVPGVPQEYGVSIFSTLADQNLYIKNNFDYPVKFEFKVDNKKVVLTVSK